MTTFDPSEDQLIELAATGEAPATRSLLEPHRERLLHMVAMRMDPRVAQRLDRRPAQIVMSWHNQRGDVVFPKTMTPERMRENIDVFGFELGADDMAALATIDRGPGGRTGADPDTFDY